MAGLLMDVEEVSEELQFHPDTIRRWLRNGEMNGSKVGQKWMVSREDLMNFYERKKKETQEKINGTS